VSVPARTDFSIEPQHDGPRAVLAVTGELDIATAPLLRLAIDAALETGASELCIDLRPTTFIDSTGVHLLVATGERLAADGARLSTLCEPGNVHRVLMITGVAGRLGLVDAAD
jgi:anti-sigma B factor antagonist